MAIWKLEIGMIFRFNYLRSFGLCCGNVIYRVSLRFIASQPWIKVHVCNGMWSNDFWVERNGFLAFLGQSAMI